MTEVGYVLDQLIATGFSEKLRFKMDLNSM